MLSAAANPAKSRGDIPRGNHTWRSGKPAAHRHSFNETKWATSLRTRRKAVLMLFLSAILKLAQSLSTDESQYLKQVKHVRVNRSITNNMLYCVTRCVEENPTNITRSHELIQKERICFIYENLPMLQKCVAISKLSFFLSCQRPFLFSFNFSSYCKHFKSLCTVIISSAIWIFNMFLLIFRNYGEKDSMSNGCCCRWSVPELSHQNHTYLHHFCYKMQSMQQVCVYPYIHIHSLQFIWHICGIIFFFWYHNCDSVSFPILQLESPYNFFLISWRELVWTSSLSLRN